MTCDCNLQCVHNCWRKHTSKEEEKRCDFQVQFGGVLVCVCALCVMGVCVFVCVCVCVHARAHVRLCVSMYVNA